MKNLDALILECEAHVRAGSAAKVARRLASVNLAKVPRAYRLPMANLCRRAGLYAQGLALLARTMNPRRAVTTAAAATPAEAAEYSVCLLRSGALDEAQARLRSIDSTAAPEALLYQAFCHLSRWESDQAIPHLEEYLKADLKPYARSVGRANLAFAFVESGQEAAAVELLNEMIRVTAEQGHLSLQSNCQALRARLLMREERFDESRQVLDAAAAVFGQAQTNDQFQITKWRMILEALETGSRLSLERLWPLAQNNFDWETLREIDYYSVKLKFDKAKYLHLVFGTPFVAFRERIVREIGEMRDRSIYVLGEKSSPRLDLNTGMIENKLSLRPGCKPHQLIEVLLRDFYRPLRIGGLFSELFPGQHFDIFSSPSRVHQIIHRTRLWQESQDIPIEIKEANGFYSLNITGKFSFRVNYARATVEATTLRFDRLAKVYKKHPSFSAREAREKLSLSRRVFQELLTWGIAHGRIERLGVSRHSARYRIVADVGALAAQTAAA